MKKSLLSLILLFALSGCATHVVKLGKTDREYTPTIANEVEVYYDTMPKCKYEEIALIDNPLNTGILGKWSDNLQKSVNQIKNIAAQQGADFIVLKKYRKSLIINDKLVDYVVAYKCIN